MGFYRFVESRHLDSVLRGELRFTALAYYRLMEMVYEDEWIGDSQEGQAISRIKSLSLAAGEDQNGLRKKLEAVGLMLGQNVDLKISNTNFTFEENGFILSFAVGELEDLKQSMWRDSYDACLSFTDIEALASYVYQHGTDGQGRKASDLFYEPVVDAVVYGVNEVDLLAVEKHLEGSPLLKREKYINQKECRIFFKPKIDLDVDVVTFALNVPDGYIVEEFRNTAPPQIKKWIEPETFPDPFGKLVEMGLAIKSVRRSHDELTNDKKELITSYVRVAKFAYWQLRQDRTLEHGRCSRLDSFFCMKNYNGGSITHFVYLLDKYFKRVAGMPEWP